MKFLNKFNIISLAVIVLTLVVQLVPFTHSTKIYSEVEDVQQYFDETTNQYVVKAKTWAELPIGVTGKDRGSWPSEIKFGEFKDLDPVVQEKYPLYGEKNISIFTFVQVLFIAFVLFSFLVKNFLAKAVVAFLFGFSHIWAFVRSLLLSASGELEPYTFTLVLLIVIGLAVIAAGVYFVPEYFKEKAKNEAVRKSL